MSKLMDNNEFVAKVLNVANNQKTVYMLGCFGAPLSKKLISDKAKQLPHWYTAARKRKFENLIGKGYFGFDCVNLIKGILWGWDGNQNAIYGGAKYASHGVPDTNADGMINICKHVTSDFSAIQKGEVVWMPGHIGVYIGGGKVVESTPAWADKVQITACLNIGPIGGLKGRKWQKHGKLPWLEYEIDAMVEYLNLVKPQIIGDIRKWQNKAAADSDVYWLIRKTKEYIEQKGR